MCFQSKQKRAKMPIGQIASSRKMLVRCHRIPEVPVTIVNAIDMPWVFFIYFGEKSDRS